VSGQELTIVYSLIDLGREKIAARYLGAAEAVSLNLSVLQASLAGLEPKHLLAGEISRTIPTEWTRLAGPAPMPVIVPAGWLVEPGGPSACGGLGEAALGFVASPTEDFTLQLRAAWRPDASIDIGRAARACAAQDGSSGEGSYVSTVDWWGTPYRLEGVLIASGGGLWQLEAIAPAGRIEAIAPVFQAWKKTIAR
jgi:hypothetical protein